MIYVDRSSISFVDEPKTPAQTFLTQRKTFLTPKNIQDEVRAFTEKTSTLAEQILNKDAPIQSQSSGDQNIPAEKTVVIRHYYTPWYSPIWWRSYQPVYVMPTPVHSHQDNESQLRCVVGIVAAVAAGAALFAIGSAIPRLHDSERELDDACEFHEALDTYHPSNQFDQQLVHEARQIVNLKERLCKRIKDSAVADLALRIGLAVGCGAALVAAIVGSPFLIKAGALAALIAAGGMLFKWGFETTDKQNLRDANAILNAAQRLNHDYLS